MGMVGNLHDFSFSELLHMLGRGSKTGQLSVWAPAGVSHIWFYRGKVVGASAPGQQLNLQQQLSQDEELKSKCNGSSEQVLSKLASLCCPVNQPLGTCLRKQGLISPSVLVKAFRQQLEAGVFILFELEDGQFNFNTKAPIPYGEITGLSKACLDIAVEGLRRVDLQNQQLPPLPSQDACFRRYSNEPPPINLDSNEWSVWERVSPHKKLDQIASGLGTDIIEVQRICVRLLEVGLIQAASYQPDAPTQPQDNASSTTLSPQEESPQISTSLLSRLTSVLRGIQRGNRPTLTKSRL